MRSMLRHDSMDTTALIRRLRASALVERACMEERFCLYEKMLHALFVATYFCSLFLFHYYWAHAIKSSTLCGEYYQGQVIRYSALHNGHVAHPRNP